MIIISLSYKKRVGKDTFFDFAKEYIKNHKVVRIAFADALKDEIFDMFLHDCGVTREALDDVQYKDLLRPLMQAWGTVRRELCGSDYWVKKAFDKATDEDTVYIITDCRFLNELNYVKNYCGKSHTVHIKKDTGFDDGHVSEVELDNHHDKFDFTIENNGTMEEYRDKVYAVCEAILAQ